MDMDTRVKAADGIVSTEIDGEAVLLQIERGVYFGLNAVGTAAWRLMSTAVSIAQICSAVLEEFEVEPTVCRQDILMLLQQLKQEGLIELDAQYSQAE